MVHISITCVSNALQGQSLFKHERGLRALIGKQFFKCGLRRSFMSTSECPSEHCIQPVFKMLIFNNLQQWVVITLLLNFSAL